jgi:hypothetical protein
MLKSHLLWTARRGLLALWCCLCAGPLLAATPYFDFTPTAKDAYRKAISLRFGEAKAALTTLRASEPDNLVADFVENYIDFLTVMVNDDKAQYQQLLKKVPARLSKIARGDRNSPYCLYAQGEIRLQWALLRGRYDEMLASLTDIKQGYGLLKENDRRFPDFVANKKSLGIMHALVGNIPDEYRWAVKAVGGISGDIQRGLREIESVLTYARSNDFIFEEESAVAYAYLLLQIGNQSETAWRVLKSGKINPRDNPLLAVAMANLAIRLGRNDEAIQLLQNAPSGGAYHPFPYRHFMLGLAKLYRLDGDANAQFDLFIKNFKGRYAIKEAYQKLAWFYLSQGSLEGYRLNIGLVRQHGAERTETDKIAMREAKSGEIPDPQLLKARLLFDGGYYQRAYDLLKNSEGNYTGKRKFALEYTYRMGRIAHRLGHTDEAIRFYGQTIEQGANEPWFFACNAALQLGLLHEERRDRVNARTAFRRCLAIRPEEYRTSLHTKAQAGLNRLK